MTQCPAVMRLETNRQLVPTNGCWKEQRGGGACETVNGVAGEGQQASGEGGGGLWGVRWLAWGNESIQTLLKIPGSTDDSTMIA